MKRLQDAQNTLLQRPDALGVVVIVLLPNGAGHRAEGATYGRNGWEFPILGLLALQQTRMIQAILTANVVPGAASPISVDFGSKN